MNLDRRLKPIEILLVEDNPRGRRSGARGTGVQQGPQHSARRRQRRGGDGLPPAPRNLRRGSARPA